jgi:UDP-2-acetamido-2,6-beta-L-arabino-hexul-4-ose reductase
LDKPNSADLPRTVGTIIEVLQTHRDSRGSLFEPLNDQELARQKNVHVVLTEPGGVRGNHFHRTAVEMTAVVGPCQVRLKESNQIREVEVPA